jgi:hypothetical protein
MRDRSPKYNLGLLQSTSLGDRIAISLPECQAFLETAQCGLLLGVSRGVGHHHGVSIMTVAGFDHLVRANQIHGIGVQAVVFHQWVALDDRFDVFSGLGLGGVGDFCAILHAAFYEDRQGRCSNDPVSVIRDTVQPGAVASTGRSEEHPIKVARRQSKARHHGQEQFRV